MIKKLSIDTKPHNSPPQNVVWGQQNHNNEIEKVTKGQLRVDTEFLTMDLKIARRRDSNLTNSLTDDKDFSHELADELPTQHEITGAMNFTQPSSLLHVMERSPTLAKVLISGKAIGKHNSFLVPAELPGKTDAPESPTQNQNLYASRRFIKIQEKVDLKKFFNDRKDLSGPKDRPQNKKHRLTLDSEDFSPSKIGALLMPQEFISAMKISPRRNLVDCMHQCKNDSIKMKEADALYALNRKNQIHEKLQGIAALSLMFGKKTGVLKDTGQVTPQGQG